MRAVNLIPADQRRGAGGIAGRSGGIVYVVAGGLVVVAALGVVYAFEVHSAANRETQLASVTQQVAAVQSQTNALAPYVRVSALRQEKVAELVTLAEARFNWPTALQQLALALPHDVTLSTMTATAAAGLGSTAGGASASAGPTFALSGCATSQAETATVLAKLAAVPGVTGVSLTSTSKTSDAAPNSGRAKGKSSGSATGACTFVSFVLNLSYSPSYTVPNATLPHSPSTPQTISSASRGKPQG